MKLKGAALLAGWLKAGRSAGARTAPAVRRLIRRGDTARDARRWSDAADAYRATLAADPDLHHIRIQLGHMLKEGGSLEEADAVYADAARLRTDDAEPLLHRAHLAKRRATSREATALFIATLGRGDWKGEAERELRRMLDLDADLPSEVFRDLLLDAHRPEAIKDAATDEEAVSLATDRPLMFDVTDLIGHFRHQRLPTGIQRVQIEVLGSAFRTPDGSEPMLSCFVSGRSEMLAVPSDLFLRLLALTRSGDDVADAEWQIARARLFVHLALAGNATIPKHAVLINLGTSLWVDDYFLFIRNAKAHRQIRYIPFVHDLIPVIAPQHCVPGLREDFAAWLAGLFQHADGFLTNSQSTARDLLRAASHLGRDVDLDCVEVVPLDADFRSDVAPPAVNVLRQWGLQDRPYALMVSTIEPRKNHVLAFEAWAELIRRQGAASVPQLVCVGRDGWLNERVFARLAADPALIAGVTIIHGVSDAELALLYRHSRFTVYPSLYEGWGLPITEALCHGKVPVIADNSALPEAGAGLALIFESDSALGLAAAVEKVAFDEPWRREREGRIAAEFVPRSWAEIAAQIIDASIRLASSPATAPKAPTVRRDVYYPVNLHRAAEIWPGLMSGEIFRVGDGWLWPQPDGCRTRPAGGILRMRLADGVSRLYLRLRGLLQVDCPVIVTLDSQNFRVTIPAGATAWMACDVPEDTPMLSLTVRGLVVEEVTLSIGGRDVTIAASVTVVGFLPCDRLNEAANQRAIANIDRWKSL